MKKNTSRAGWPLAFLSVAIPILMASAPSGAVLDETSGRRLGQMNEKPNLVVVVIVDQLRGDMLDRYSSLFTGGFKRLLGEGLVFTNALHEHAQTETSPGHATISTGVFPSRAGIPSNVWREGEGDDAYPVYNVVDPDESLVEIPGVPGSSPRVLKRSGLADWIEEAGSGVKVVSISAKDRAAVLMAGKTKGEVYWFDSRLGKFVTSTYYRPRNPSWLSWFNLEGMKKYAADTAWISKVPPEAAHLSAPDTADFEANGVHSFFPHLFSLEVPDPTPEDFFFWLESTPMLDEATLDVALLAIEEEGLGQKDGRTDFLSISFSQVDRVGHAYGPLSREQMDNLLRLDLLVGILLSKLDERVGREKYVLGFTSDHGVMTMPERMDGFGKRLTVSDGSQLEQALGAAARQIGPRSVGGTAQALVNAMKTVPFVGPAYTHEALANGVPGDSMASFFQHSYTPGRPGGLLSSYGVEMWWAENVLSWSLPVGTTHGSPFRYDRWVPMILLGPGIERGVVDKQVRPMDLAPTLAEIAGIPFPDDLDGVPLLGESSQSFKVRGRTNSRR